VGSSLGARPEPRYTRHLRAIPLEDLFAMGEAVQSLAAHPGWNHVNALLDAEVAEIDRSLDGATEPLSQAEYALQHGRRGGLRGAREALDAIVAVSRDRLEEQRRKHERDAESSQEAVVT
jgi:hypothetical protein